MGGKELKIPNQIDTNRQIRPWIVNSNPIRRKYRIFRVDGRCRSQLISNPILDHHHQHHYSTVISVSRLHYLRLSSRDHGQRSVHVDRVSNRALTVFRDERGPDFPELTHVVGQELLQTTPLSISSCNFCCAGAAHQR